MDRSEGRKSTFAPRGPLRGTAVVPGDKSISHRALILTALAMGTSRIEGLNDGADVAATARALAAMGARIEREADGARRVAGVGVGGLLKPEAALDMGNSGTAARLLIGLVASHPIRAIFTGDASFSRRPMDRLAVPLRRIGARIDGDRMPLTVEGLAPAIPVRHSVEIPSAQVKSALLLAGLNTPGVTEVVESIATRDHTERLLRMFGAEVEIDGAAVRLHGEAELGPRRLAIPGDPSAAAFLAIAALVVPGSEVRIEGLCANPRRMGLFRILCDMGADLAFENVRERSGEPIADLVARHSALTAVDVPPEIVADMIDEFPALFVAAAFADGTTHARGLAELRVKESDRIAAMAEGLRAVGVVVEESEDGLAVRGTGGDPLPGGSTIATRVDHRIAMSFAVSGLHAAEPIGIDDMTPVATSFPTFDAVIRELAG